MSRIYFSIAVSMDYVVGIDSILIAYNKVFIIFVLDYFVYILFYSYFEGLELSCVF